MIEVENVTKKYGKFTAVDNISFTIKEGEIVGLLRTKWCGKIHHIKERYQTVETDRRRSLSRFR